MMVMAAGQMVGRIFVAGLGRVMIVGMVLYDGSFAEQGMVVFERNTRRMLDLVDRRGERGAGEDDGQGDTKHRPKPVREEEPRNAHGWGSSR